MMVDPARKGCTSVIIPAWNGVRYLPDCLEALLAQDCPDMDVIVVDNASSDGSADLVSSRFPVVRLIRNNSNLGFAGACNLGLRAARGRVLVLLNQDTRVRQGWLCALADAVQDPRIGVVGSKIFYPDGHTLQHAGGWIEWPLGLAHHYGHGQVDAGQWNEPRQVECVTGAAMAFRRDVLERIGLLDEGFWPGYFEDTDLCFRAREAGYEVWYAPDAVLTHEETTSLDDVVTLSRAYHRGRLCFLLKHLPPQRFLSEFVPAEQVYLRGLGRGYAGNLLRTSYLEAITTAATVLPRRWPVDECTVEQILSALQDLFQAQLGDTVSSVPNLQEFEFRSSVPFIGPFLARVRLLWYSVAARWAIRYLIQQQEAINQQQDVCIRSLISMSREIAHLALVLRDSQQGQD